ncbi:MULTISPECIES: GMC family oxidoreductase [unclassified Sphingobium]|uniref:GMC family oxidoreductase n=1 Tax=unclassified Sphingobium TaxID=2611147 RepID=UPI0035A6E430
MSGTATEFDYVIVGAGTAGSLMAARLAETPGVTVCVLEAGPADTDPNIGFPPGFMKMIFNPKATWGFVSEPGEGLNGRSIPAIQGRVVGGSMAVNGMVYTRGQAADFDKWAQLGNPGWGYDDILPYFRKTETNTDKGDPRYRGQDGKLPIVALDWKNDLVDAFIRGASELGIPYNPDYNGATQAGAGVYQYNIGKGKRINTARAFLHGARRTGRVDLRVNARATKVLFEGKTAKGVSYTRDEGASVQTVTARREVILCSGAINTPRLLQVSGIGDPEHLREIGVDVVHALPGVGQNLRDHITPRTVVKVRGATSLNQIANSKVKIAGQMVNWLRNKPSVIGIGVVLGQIFWKSNPALDNPDMLVTFTPGSFKEGFLGVLDDVPGMTLGAWQLRPESTGYVKAKSTDLFEAPAIQPNYLSAEHDRDVLLSGQKLIRRLLNETSLKKYVVEEMMPGPSVQTDDDLRAYARRQALAGYHYCGTAKMGPATDPLAVVDASLRIHGLSNIRVIDASIMPEITSGNTNAPTMMIAEKGADMVKAAAA